MGYRFALGTLALALALAACTSNATNSLPAAGGAPNASTAGVPDAGAPFAVLNSFNGKSGGFGPGAGVVFDKHGNIYGSTESGGNTSLCNGYGCGVIYELHRAHGTYTESVLYTFMGGSDGATPAGTLAIDRAGNLYGTAYTGGVKGACYGCGVVFELTHQGSAWQEKVLYSFTGGSDGNWPGDGVVLHNGNLYGTTYGAQEPTNGSVFELAPSGSGWTETTLHLFKGGTDGAFPYCQLIFDKQGNIYGDTEGGAGGSVGTVFELSQTTSGWTETVLARYDGGYQYNEGTLPIGGLAMDKSGNLYGGTFTGGTGNCNDIGYHCGLIYELTHTSSGWQDHTLYEFTGGKDGGIMRAGLVLYKGALYGTTYQGGNLYDCSYPIPGCGVFFKLAPSGSKWTESVVDAFTNTNGGADGAYPVAELTLHKGKFFGTTYRGGASGNGYGEVFRAQP